MFLKNVIPCLAAVLFYGTSVQSFDCPEPFGVYVDPEDDHYFYVCENNLPLRGDCNNKFYVPDFCNGKNSSREDTINSGNFTDENETSCLNQTSTGHENSNCTLKNNTSEEENTYEFDFYPHYTSDNETSEMNETDIDLCNDTNLMSIDINFMSSGYIVNCRNLTNDTQIADDNYGDLNDTDKNNDTYHKMNDTYEFEISPNFLSDNESFPGNMSSINETYEIVVNTGYLNKRTENVTGHNHTNNNKNSTGSSHQTAKTTTMATDMDDSLVDDMDFECPSGNGLYPDLKDKTCHAYWECNNNLAVHKTCNGKKKFDPASSECEDFVNCNQDHH